jgi:type I restriction enzyme, S subunit
MPLLHTPRLRHHPIHQLRREHPSQNTNRDVIREALISLRLDPTRPRHAATINRLPDTKETVLRLARTQDHITEAAVDGSAARRFPAGSIAMVVRSGILEHTLPVAQVPFAATANQDMRVLVPNASVSSDWALWALVAASETIRRRCRKDGTTVASIDVPAMQAFRIPVPPRDEQDRIVRAVEGLLVGIAQGEALAERALLGLGQYRASVLASAFVGQRAALSEVADIQTGIAKGRPESGELWEMPYIRTANVQALRLDVVEIKTLPVTERQMERYRLQMDDVLVLEGGDADKVGRGWIWAGEIEECLHQNHVFAVRPHKSQILPRYLAYYINAPQARSYFLSVAKQTTNLASINKTNLNALPVPIPSLDVQARMVEMMDHQLAETTETEAALRALLRDSEQLRVSTLHSAFSDTPLSSRANNQTEISAL